MFANSRATNVCFWHVADVSPRFIPASPVCIYAARRSPEAHTTWLSTPICEQLFISCLGRVCDEKRSIVHFAFGLRMR